MSVKTDALGEMADLFQENERLRKELDAAHAASADWNRLWHRDVAATIYAEDVARSAMREGLKECMRLRAAIEEIAAPVDMSDDLNGTDERWTSALAERLSRVLQIARRALNGEKSEVWEENERLRTEIARRTAEQAGKDEMHIALMVAYDRLASAVWGGHAPAISAAEHERAATELRRRATEVEAARAERDAERANANEWLAQLHDAKRALMTDALPMPAPDYPILRRLREERDHYRQRLSETCRTVDQLRSERFKVALDAGDAVRTIMAARKDAHDALFEDAALECDDEALKWRARLQPAGAGAALNCASRVRALKTKKVE